MPSREFNTLKKNTRLLRAEFLSFTKRADGHYTRGELLKCRAFITFAHAEIEHYLEMRALRILDRAEAKWDRYQTATRVVAGLLAFSITKPITIAGDPREQSGDKKLSSLVKQAFSTQRGVIKANNGLKPENLSRIFIPLGFKPEDIGETLVIQLKNLGTARGGLVHSNTQVSLPKIRDPFDDEYRDIEYLISELKNFDEIVRSL
ncbi:hypothetical protein ACTL6U_19730 [Rhodovibrionaceae bacterium A322]